MCGQLQLSYSDFLSLLRWRRFPSGLHLGGFISAPPEFSSPFIAFSTSSGQYLSSPLFLDCLAFLLGLVYRKVHNMLGFFC